MAWQSVAAIELLCDRFPAAPALDSMQPDRSRLVCITIIVAAALMFVLLRAPFLSLPLERDEGEYAYIAQRAAAGDVPYRDAFDQKPPGIFVAYRLAFSLFGESIEGIHLFAHLWSAATVVCLFALVARVAGPIAAAFAALVLSIVTADPRIGATAANTELFMIGPLVAAVYCLVRALQQERAIWWIACGFLTVSALWFKQVAIVHGILIALVAVIPAWGGADRWAVKRLARIGGLVSLGAALAASPVLIYFWQAGAWDPFLHAVFLHNFEYAQSVPLAVGAQALWNQLTVQWPSQGVFWLTAIAAMALPRLSNPRSWSLMTTYVVISALGVSVGLYFRPHYFVQLAPALAGLSGIALAVLARPLLTKRLLTCGLGIASLLAVIIAPPVWANRDMLFADSVTSVSRQIYGMNPFPESIQIAKYIRRTSRPDDLVYVIGSEPQILFYAQRRSATRYIFFYPLTGDFDDALERQREVVEAATRSEPLYVVWVNVGTSMLLRETSELFIFEESARWIRENYQLEFIARPSASSDEFDFVYGNRGRRTLDFLDRDMTGSPWVAVFRRRH